MAAFGSRLRHFLCTRELVDEVIPGEQCDQVVFDQNEDEWRPDDATVISDSETGEEEDCEE